MATLSETAEGRIERLLDSARNVSSEASNVPTRRRRALRTHSRHADACRTVSEAAETRLRRFAALLENLPPEALTLALIHARVIMAQEKPVQPSTTDEL